MRLGAISAISPVAAIARTTAPLARPMVFSIGDGVPMTDVTVTIRNGTGQTVHTGFLEQMAGRASYTWTAPAGATTGYYISWDGKRAATDARAGVLV